jgi:hypothetical protein
VPELGSLGSVRGALSNGCPYRSRVLYIRLRFCDALPDLFLWTFKDALKKSGMVGGIATET